MLFIFRRLIAISKIFLNVTLQEHYKTPLLVLLSVSVPYLKYALVDKGLLSRAIRSVPSTRDCDESISRGSQVRGRLRILLLAQVEDFPAFTETIHSSTDRGKTTRRIACLRVIHTRACSSHVYIIYIYILVTRVHAYTRTRHAYKTRRLRRNAARELPRTSK